MTDPVDVAVIGGGPAGLSAALWLGRYRRRTLVVDAGEPRNRMSEEVHGYLGFDGAKPADLIAAARRELCAYSTVTLRTGRVETLERAGDGFRLRVDDAELGSRRVILATGVVDELPDVENFYEHYGESVFHCPSCDGYEARDRVVVVFGWTEEVATFAMSLLDWAGDVTIVADGHRFEGDDAQRAALADHGIEVVEDEAVALLGERGGLAGVRLRSGATLDCQLAFFSIGQRPATELARSVGCLMTPNGCLEVDEHGETSVPGLYAAGDITPGPQLVQVAAAEGATAGIACARAFAGEETNPDSPSPAPEAPK